MSDVETLRNAFDEYKELRYKTEAKLFNKVEDAEKLLYKHHTSIELLKNNFTLQSKTLLRIGYGVWSVLLLVLSLAVKVWFFQ